MSSSPGEETILLAKAVASYRGKNYEASKLIRVVPPPSNIPVLSIDRTSEGPGWYIIFNVSNTQPGATYEWDVIQGETMWASSDFIYVYCPEEQFEGSYGPYLIVRCRATINGTTSEWSPAYYVLLNYFENANSAGQTLDAEGVPLDIEAVSLDIGDGILLR